MDGFRSLLLGPACAALTLGLVACATASPRPGTVLLHDSFAGSRSLITNDYLHWNPGRLADDRIWEMTSGSLFARRGWGWTGRPDGCEGASADSVPCTASAVFRLNTARQDFGDVTVSMKLRNERLVSSARTPAVAWDGVHLWLRHLSEYHLYALSFNRRDGQIVIKKKCPGGDVNGGTYYELGPGALGGHPIPFGRVQRIAARAENNRDGSVTLSMYSGGRRLLAVTDRGLGCAPIRAAGAVGVRGDNDEFEFDDFAVTAN